MILADVLGLDFAQILDDLGYAGLVALMVGETVFPPIPSEAVLPLAGYLAERGDLTLPLVLLYSTVGSVVGAMLLYEAALRGGRPFVLAFMRFGRIPQERLGEAEGWFEKRGPLVVLFGRCIPGVRSLVSLPAGLLRMGRLQYLGLTLAGSLVWNSILVGAGYALGSKWEDVEDVIGPLSKPLLAVAVVGTAAALWWWGLKSRRARLAERGLPGDGPPPPAA